MEPETPLFLLATAGMRLLEPEQQARVLSATCKFLKLHSHFRIELPSAFGPCGSSVRIITGEEEGLFGWIAVNYLMDGFTGSSTNRTTYGFLDMGGASTQIAFEPGPEERALAKNLVDVRLRLLGGTEIHHEVFVTTWLGYGTNQARERYVAQAVDAYERTHPTDAPRGALTEGERVPDPCLPQHLELLEKPAHVGEANAHASKAHKLVGTGSFAQCLRATAPLLNKNTPCPDSPCLFNGVHVPPIDFSVARFIGVSEYWYSSEDAFGLGGPYDFAQYEAAAEKFCARAWEQIVREHQGSTSPGSGADDDGVHWAKHGNKATLERLKLQCFKAAWIANVLHEGIGMPRLGLDPGGNGTPGAGAGSGGAAVSEEAKHKGLGPVFQSVDSVGDVAISWTLGKMVLEASKEVPPAVPNARPLTDPLDDIPAGSDSPIKPIRPPFLDFDGWEDSIAHRLPPVLTRHSLGFSLIGVLFYATIATLLLLLACRLRFRLRPILRRLKRGRLRAPARDYLPDAYAMEEGHTGNGSSTPRPFLSRLGVRPLPLQTGGGSPRTPTRPSPVRAYSLPLSAYPAENDFRASAELGVGDGAGGGSPILHSPSYSTAYAGGSPGTPVGGAAAPGLTSFARSRNTSQISLLPRPMSRANSNAPHA